MTEFFWVHLYFRIPVFHEVKNKSCRSCSYCVFGIVRVLGSRPCSADGFCIDIFGACCQLHEESFLGGMWLRCFMSCEDGETASGWRSTSLNSVRFLPLIITLHYLPCLLGGTYFLRGHMKLASCIILHRASASWLCLRSELVVGTLDLGQFAVLLRCSRGPLQWPAQWGFHAGVHSERSRRNLPLGHLQTAVFIWGLVYWGWRRKLLFSVFKDQNLSE